MKMCFRSLVTARSFAAKHSSAIVAGFGIALAFSCTESKAEFISVPNFSFETPRMADFGNPPAIPFDAVPGVDIAAPWKITQSTPQQIGAFPNQPVNAPDYIDNATGNQVAFMFAGSGITLFQDLSTTGAVFELGKAYRFTIAAGGNGGLPDDARLQLRLYYRDASANKVTVATSSFLFDPDLDPGSINHLYDYSVLTSVVQSGDAWLGKAIGIEISTPSGPGSGGAYWDLDNARVESVPEPSGAVLLTFGAMLLGTRNRRRM